MTTTKKTTAADVDPLVAFAATDGADLLIPPNKVSGVDQIRLLGRLTSMQGATEEDVDIDKMADLAAFASEHYAVDRDAFDAWSSGAGGGKRTLTLAMAYVAAVGKLFDSENS